MLGIEREIMKLGGVARTADLYAAGQWQSMLQLHASYGVIIRVRRGWWATRHTSPAVIAACRAGGRLACVSALAHHGKAHGECGGEGEGEGLLHVSLERWGKLPRDPQVVAHWGRRQLPGDRAAVSAASAARQAQRCSAYNQSRRRNER